MKGKKEKITSKTRSKTPFRCGKGLLKKMGHRVGKGWR